MGYPFDRLAFAVVALIGKGGRCYKNKNNAEKKIRFERAGNTPPKKD
jgi:hypothetical protein